MIVLVNENQLDDWVRGNAREAQALIVELAWRLVAASCPHPRERHFPLGDSIGQHGPDGIVDDALGFEPFVPEGRSIWAIGTGLKARAKATSDYGDLTPDVPAEVRRESTFIFVTPLSGRREWEQTWKPAGQASWLASRRKKGDWRDLRVIDGTKLIDWVRRFPAVELWLAHKITGIGTEQIDTPEQRWELLKRIGEPPPLPPTLFLANREDACKRLADLFEGATMQVRLGDTGSSDGRNRTFVLKKNILKVPPLVRSRLEKIERYIVARNCGRGWVCRQEAPLASPCPLT